MPESVVGALTDAYGEDGYAQGMASLGNVIAAANAAVTAKQQWQQVSADYDNRSVTSPVSGRFPAAVSASLNMLNIFRNISDADTSCEELAES